VEQCVSVICSVNICRLFGSDGNERIDLDCVVSVVAIRDANIDSIDSGAIDNGGNDDHDDDGKNNASYKRKETLTSATA
jgi:hypothetical protein